MNEQEEQTVEGRAEVESAAPRSKQKFKMGPKRTLRVIGFVVVALLIVLVIKIDIESGTIVATVNGEEISKKELDLRVELVLSSSQVEGIDTDDPAFRVRLEEQVLGELIDTALLLQGASDKGISADEIEVEEQYQTIITQFGGEEVLKDALSQSGVKLSELRKNIEDQIVINAFIYSQAEGGSVVATEEEVAKLYDREAAFQDNMPPLEGIYSELEAQVIAEKTQAIAIDLIGQLREEADIEIVSKEES